MGKLTFCSLKKFIFAIVALLIAAKVYRKLRHGGL